MSDFVEQCRREWKRLQVPDPLAEEMAADLASDLREAEAEGVSAEELLGRSVFDPKTFAASWAAERGIIPAAPERRTRRRPLVLVAFTAVSALVVFVSALALATGQPQASIVATTRSHRPSARPPATSSPRRAWRLRSNGSCWFSRSSRSASPPGCGRAGTGRDPRGAFPPRRDDVPAPGLRSRSRTAQRSTAAACRRGEAHVVDPRPAAER